MKTSEILSVKDSYYFFAQMRSVGLNYRKMDENLYDEMFMYMKDLKNEEQFHDIVNLNQKALLYM